MIQTIGLTNPDLDFDPEFVQKFYEVYPRLRMYYTEIPVYALIQTANDSIHYLKDLLVNYS